MSQYFSTEEMDLVQVASNQGYADFCDWVRSLDAEKYDELTALVEEGDAYDLGYLAGQMRDALNESPPSADVVSTVEGMITFLLDNEDAEMVMVTNGMTADGDEDDGDDDDGEPEESDDESRSVDAIDAMIERTLKQIQSKLGG